MNEESLIGLTLGHYRVLEKLGAGGMGEVYLAEDLDLKRRVAVKVLPPDLAADPERMARFQREAESLAALNHPNIVTLYAIESAEERRLLVMELVEGHNLEHEIPPQGMELGQFFEVALPLADALSAAHEKGITHRDLKPANVMLSDEGRVKVLDFGLAKLMEAGPQVLTTELATEALTQEGVVVGTMPYMSPEQIEGKTVDHRSDIFSLGILLYEMASGARPFSGESSPALMSSILKDRPQPVTERRADLPRHLGRIVEQCLEKDPRDRIQTARDVYNQLRALRREVESGSMVTGSHVATASVPAAAEPRPESITDRRVLGVPIWMIFALSGMLFGLVTLWLTLGRDSDRPAAEVETGVESSPGRDAAAVAETGARKMMVVLPFENLGPPEQEYFADGMTEEITSRLATVGELGVISRTSAMQYKQTRPPIQQIGEELGVGYVLEGTVRWAGDAGGAGRVRVTTQLIEVEADTYLWAENYERVLDDIFKVQSDIAGEVIDQLGVTLLDDERQALSVRPTENLEAYQAYLRGNDLIGDLDEERSGVALEMFRQAVELDPGFMSAWARLARVGASRYHFGYDRSDELESASLAAAEKALELAPDSSEAHMAMGFYHYHVNKDYQPALAAFDRAIEIQGDNADALEGKALVLRRIMRWEESIGVHEQAMKFNPRDAALVFNLADSYQSVRDYSRSDALFGRCIELQPDFFYAYFYRALNFWQWQGDLEKSRSMLETMPDTGAPDAYWVWWFQEMQEGDHEAALAWTDRIREEAFPLGAHASAPSLLRGLTHHLAGHPELARPHFEEARSILETATESRQDGFRYRSALGIALAGLGRKDEAIRQGERAVADYPVSRDSAWGPDIVVDLAHIYAMVGESEKAVERLEYVLSIPSFMAVAWLKIDPRWDSLRGSPAFQDLVERHR